MIFGEYELVYDGVIDDKCEATSITNLYSCRRETINEFMTSSSSGWLGADTLNLVGESVRDYNCLLFRRKVK